jgi:hypothetical protein
MGFTALGQAGVLAWLDAPLGFGHQRGREWRAAVEHTAVGPPGDQ